MRVIALTILAASAIATLPSVTPAQARDYKYCLQGRDAGYPGDCRFTSFRQCQASASGTYSECGLNPRYVYAQRYR